ncbi:hypothetical protein ERJ75_001251900 [Trypanosoma vivax]|nr:hypothetical protein TRVL_00547 [Trypanosoma vivax]KAH8608828.1 hypothetical protein ERJ75_001251900 [Trypanosoma vivax]
MQKSDMAKLRMLPKVLPHHPYARNIVGMGTGKETEPTAPHLHASFASLRVVGIYCTRMATKDETHVEDPPRSEGQSTVAVEPQCSKEPTAKRRLYVRVQFERAGVDTLPLEVMREKYPQVLIDFLLSTAVWT